MPEGDRSVPNAVAGMASATAASDQQPCLNPACPALRRAASANGDANGQPTSGRSGLCSWPSKGRPGYFCSRECREQYDYERAQLKDDIRALDEAVHAGGGTYRDRRRVETELAKRRWAWQRYLFDPAHVTTPETPSGDDD